MSFAHGEKPTFSEKGVRPQPVIFTSSARVWPLLLFAQDCSQTTTYKAIKGANRVTMGMLEVTKPAYDGRIQIGYEVFDAVASRFTSLQTDFILEPFETLFPNIAAALFKPLS